MEIMGRFYGNFAAMLIRMVHSNVHLLDIFLNWGSLFGLCGVDDIIRLLICMLQKPEYLWNMRY